MSISFFNEDSNIELSLKQKDYISTWLLDTISQYNFLVGELNYIFCSDSYLLEINQSHLNHDTYTDIITFDLSEEGESISGDIFISTDRILDNSKTFNTSFSKEFARVVVHGVLHLIGFNDKSEKESKLMREKEDFHIKGFNIEIL